MQDDFDNEWSALVLSAGRSAESGFIGHRGREDSSVRSVGTALVEGSEEDGHLRGRQGVRKADKC